MSHVFKQIFFQTVTPLHIGCGQDVGVVDLPVIRERTTGFPLIPGSGIRGPLRARATDQDSHLALRLFGAESGDDGAGCLAILDARLLLFPVRSEPGLFRWITCPYVLERWAADCELFLGSRSACVSAPPTEKPLTGDQYLGAQGAQGALGLEEYTVDHSGKFEWTLSIPGVDPKHVVLVSDDLFRDLTELATMVIQRNKLNANKVVVDGALFSLEAVPPEAVFYGFVGATRERLAKAKPKGSSPADGSAPQAQRLTDQEVLAAMQHIVSTPPVLFLGGEESVGYGLTRIQSWSKP